VKYAYIFDFDGVLVNTMEAHYTCYKKILSEVGVPINKKEFYRLAGKTGKEMALHFCNKAKKEVDIEEIYNKKGLLYKKYFDYIKPINSNIQLFKKLKQSGIPVAIASGSSRPSITPVAKKYGLIPDAIVTSEDVKRGKPNPDLFLKAAELLSISPKKCIVIEDSETGVLAASAAGMKAFHFFNK
jgi:HAD superfamily hydrolase (TIGR01509 family)